MFPTMSNTGWLRGDEGFFLTALNAVEDARDLHEEPWPLPVPQCFALGELAARETVRAYTADGFPLSVAVTYGCVAADQLQRDLLRGHLRNPFAL